RALGRLDNLASRAVDQTMVERLQANANILVSHLSHSRARRAPGTPFFRLFGKGYFNILATTPATTVLPPSRMAKRRPSSIAIGLISSTLILMLSPGMIISVPAGNSIAPVTSVVRK